MNQKILAISGRKQAGKDTCYKFLSSLLGGLGGEAHQFYFAEPLKRMCVEILGCPKDKVYGTDQDKNTEVPHLLWENFPVEVFESPNGNTAYVPDVESIHNEKWDSEVTYVLRVPKGSKRKKGLMTVREVLQYWGSEIFRRQYNNVWADACIRAIRESKVPFSIITDCRFPNEVAATQKAGGRVIRLTRTVFPDDTHISETSLDEDKFNWDKFDSILYNDDYGVLKQCGMLYTTLNLWGWLPNINYEVVLDHARRAME